MSTDVLTSRPCAEDCTEGVETTTDHVVNTVTGEACCTVCAQIEVLDLADLLSILED